MAMTTPVSRYFDGDRYWVKTQIVRFLSGNILDYISAGVDTTDGPERRGKAAEVNSSKMRSL